MPKFDSGKLEQAAFKLLAEGQNRCKVQNDLKIGWRQMLSAVAVAYFKWQNAALIRKNPRSIPRTFLPLKTFKKGETTNY